MENKFPYQYQEKPASVLLTRRALFKVLGFLAAFLGVCIGVFKRFFSQRTKYIIMRQNGLYKDDQIHQKEGLAASFQNPTVQEFYKEFAGHPMSEIAEELLHTHYVDRNNLILLSENKGFSKEGEV